jgi:hypothetical protein
MSVVEPDDVSPWTRDDWTGTDTPRLDALTSPDSPPPGGSPSPSSSAPRTARQESQSDQHGPDANVVSAPDSGPRSDEPPAPQRRSLGRFAVGALAVAMIVSIVVVATRDGGTDERERVVPESTVAAGLPGGDDLPTTTIDPVAEELAARDAARERAAAAEREAAAARAGSAGGVTPAVAQAGAVPDWTEWAIEVPESLAAIADTEVVTITTAGVLHRLELPSGRVRSLIVPEPESFDWKLAVGDEAIVLYDNREIVVIRDDRPVQALDAFDTLLNLQAWPSTSVFVATTNPSPAVAAQRFLLDVDTEVVTPLSREVELAMPFGAGSFLGSGDLLVDRPGGTYAIDPDQQARRVDEGRLRAVGRNHFAVERCDETLQCSEFMIDARTGELIPAVLAGIDPVGLVDPSSHVSPDGRSIVFTDPTRATGIRQILDVGSGNRVDIGRLDAIYSPDPWTPDGSGVFTEVEGIMRFQTVGRAEATDLDVFGPIAELVVRRS